MQYYYFLNLTLYVFISQCASKTMKNKYCRVQKLFCGRAYVGDSSYTSFISHELAMELITLVSRQSSSEIPSNVIYNKKKFMQCEKDELELSARH